jgi:hypothetical protein
MGDLSAMRDIFHSLHAGVVRYREPRNRSEAERERAARGGEGALYSWGDTPPELLPVTPGVGRVVLSRWIYIRQTLTGFTIWATTCTNGADRYDAGYYG